MSTTYPTKCYWETILRQSGTELEICQTRSSSTGRAGWQQHIRKDWWTEKTLRPISRCCSPIASVLIRGSGQLGRKTLIPTLWHWRVGQSMTTAWASDNGAPVFDGRL